jgi:hypothetical protein
MEIDIRQPDQAVRETKLVPALSLFYVKIICDNVRTSPCTQSVLWENNLR